MKKSVGARLQSALLGFAAGVMTAASVWSLLLPSIALAGKTGAAAWLAPAAGFLSGLIFMLMLEELIARLPRQSGIAKADTLTAAVTLHNIPEGMAVGVAVAGALSGSGEADMLCALALAVGIAVQNVPEGAIISLPLVSRGVKKPRAVLAGILSGAVEPVGTALTVLLTEQFVPVMPFVLAFAAGAMMFAVTDELIPEASSAHPGGAGTIGMGVGFTLMMVLDVALG